MLSKGSIAIAACFASDAAAVLGARDVSIVNKRFQVKDKSVG
jgi:hypothetical protein